MWPVVKNEIGYITEENRFQNVGPSIRTFPQANINIIGSLLNSFYGYRTAGLFQEQRRSRQLYQRQRGALLARRRGR